MASFLFALLEKASIFSAFGFWFMWLNMLDYYLKLWGFMWSYWVNYCIAQEQSLLHPSVCLRILDCVTGSWGFDGFLYIILIWLFYNNKLKNNYLWKYLTLFSKVSYVGHTIMKSSKYGSISTMFLVIRNQSRLDRFLYCCKQCRNWSRVGWYKWKKALYIYPLHRQSSAHNKACEECRI